VGAPLADVALDDEGQDNLVLIAQNRPDHPVP
jgi:hypothetical protein